VQCTGVYGCMGVWVGPESLDEPSPLPHPHAWVYRTTGAVHGGVWVCGCVGVGCMCV